MPSQKRRASGDADGGTERGTSKGRASVAGAAAMLNATPAVLLALGPLASVGLGKEAFGVMLMFMGFCGATVQMVFFKYAGRWRILRIPLYQHQYG